MKMTAILIPIYAAVESWAKPYGGRVTLSDDPKSALDLMCSAKGFTCALFWQADQLSILDTDFIGNNMCQGDIGIALFRPPELGVRGNDIPKILELVDELRTVVTGMDLPGLVDRAPTYSSMRVLTTEEGQLLHGYGLVFKVSYTHEVKENKR